MFWIVSAWAQEPTAPTGDDEPVEAPLEEVVVTGTRTEHALGDSPVAVEIIDRETIERSGATSAADLLERAAGVRMTRGAFGASLALQGLNPEHTLVLVDGQRLVGRKDGVLDLSRISPERIERIEIVKGPGSTLYGSDAMGGVVNIITRDPEGTTFAADTRYGGFGTFDGSGTLEARAGGLGSVTTIGLHKQETYDLDPTTAATDGVAYDALEGAQTLTVDAGPNHDLTANASYLSRGTTATEEQLTGTGSVGGARFLRNNRVEELLAGVSDRIVVTERSTLTGSVYLTVYRDQFFYDQADSNRDDLYEDSRQTLGELDLIYTHAFERHTATVGAEGFREWLVSPRLDEERGERIRGAVYAQDEWELVPDRFELLPGFRLDVDSQFGTAPTPRLAAAWFASDGVVVRASYGLGFRAPDFKEQLLRFANPAAGYVIEGNPDLLPERSVGGTLGVEVDRKRAHVAVQLFRNDLRDLIQIGEIPQDGFSATQYFGYENIARAWTMGVDGTVSVTPSDPLTLRAGGQLLATRDLELAQPLEGRAPVSATFGARVTEPRTGLGASVDGTWTGPRAFYPTDTDEDGIYERDDTEPFVLLDARLSWTLGAGAEIYAGGENLLDAGDADLTQLKPRWFYVGIKGRVGDR